MPRSAKKLWKLNTRTGYWDYQRSVTDETAAEWLALFREGEPDAEFKVSTNRPTPPALTPNRALTRHKLETIAWEKTPRDYRGSSGTRREVLINTTEGTTLVPLGDLTDYQLRRYIGPEALEEAGDMRANGKGRYSDTVAQPGDWVIWRHGTSGKYYFDLVRSGGTHSTAVGKPAQTLPGAISDVRKNALRSNDLSGTIFELRRSGDLVEIGKVFESQDRLNQNPSRRHVIPAPRFELGDRVTRIDEPTNVGTVGYTTRTWHGEEYGRYHYKVDWDNGAPRHTQWETKLMPYAGGPESHQRNAARGEADEVAARELSLYIENEYSLVGAPNSQGKAIEKNLEGHLRRGNFDLKKAEIAYMHLMESGAKKYAKEFASERDWHQIFSVPTRELVAHEFATTFAEEHGIKGSLTRNAHIETDEFDAPAYWASAFINGDTSGLEEKELEEFEAWCAKHPQFYVVDVSEETHIGRWNGLQTELATYTAYVQEGS